MLVKTPVLIITIRNRGNYHHSLKCLNIIILVIIIKVCLIQPETIVFTSDCQVNLLNFELLYRFTSEIATNRSRK